MAQTLQQEPVMQQDHFSSAKDIPDFRAASQTRRPVHVDISNVHRKAAAPEMLRVDRIQDREMEEPERWDGMS